MPNWTALVIQGRAKSHGLAWSNEELDAVHLLMKERGIHRTIAADYVRNGIATLKDYDNSLEKNIEPKTLDEIHADAEETIKTETKKRLKGKK
jgi:hypothetical protein